MDIALLSVQTSLGMIEDLISEPFPNILDDLPSDKELAKSALQIKRKLIDYDLNIFEEELKNAKNQLSQLTLSPAGADAASEIYQSKIQLMNAEYEKWSRYASQRIRRLKRLLSEVKLRMEVPEIIHSGAGIWTEECQILASQATTAIIESDSKADEKSEVSVKPETKSDREKIESVKSIKTSENGNVTQIENSSVKINNESRGDHGSDVQKPQMNVYSNSSGEITASANSKAKRRTQCAKVKKSLRSQMSESNDDKFIQEESDFSREIKSIPHFSRSGYVPVVPKLKQPKTVKMNQRKLRKHQKMDRSASHISRNGPRMQAKNLVCNIKVWNEPTHFSKSCFKGKPMVKMRAAPVCLNCDRAENANRRSGVTLIAEVICEVHSSEESSNMIFDEGNKKVSEFDKISKDERNYFVKTNADNDKTLVENWLYSDNFQTNSSERAFNGTLARNTTQFCNRLSSNSHSADFIFESHELVPEEVSKQMESDVKYESNLDYEKLKCVNSGQTLKVDNNRVTQVETNMSAKNVKFVGDMFRVDIQREEVLEKCKIGKVVKSDLTESVNQEEESDKIEFIQKFLRENVHVQVEAMVQRLNIEKVEAISQCAFKTLNGMCVQNQHSGRRDKVLKRPSNLSLSVKSKPTLKSVLKSFSRFRTGLQRFPASHRKKSLSRDKGKPLVKIRGTPGRPNGDYSEDSNLEVKLKAKSTKNIEHRKSYEENKRELSTQSKLIESISVGRAYVEQQRLGLEFIHGSKRVVEFNGAAENMRKTEALDDEISWNGICVERINFNQQVRNSTTRTNYQEEMKKTAFNGSFADIFAQHSDRVRSDSNSARRAFNSHELVPPGNISKPVIVQSEIKCYKTSTLEFKSESELEHEGGIRNPPKDNHAENKMFNGLYSSFDNDNKVAQGESSTCLENEKFTQSVDRISVIWQHQPVLQKRKTSKTVKGVSHTPIKRIYEKTKHLMRNVTAVWTRHLSLFEDVKRKPKLKCDNTIFLPGIGIQLLQRRTLLSCYKGKPTFKLRAAPGRAQGDCAEDPNLKNNEKLGVKWKLQCTRNWSDHMPSKSEFVLTTFILYQMKHKRGEHKNGFGWIQSFTNQNCGLNLKFLVSSSSEDACKSFNGKTSKAHDVNIYWDNISSESYNTEFGYNHLVKVNVSGTDITTQMDLICINERVPNFINSTKNVIMNVTLKLSIQYVPMNNRNKEFQSWLITKEPCQQFTNEMSKVVKEQIMPSVTTNHRLLSIVEIPNRSIGIHRGIVNVPNEKKHHCRGYCQSPLALRAHTRRSNICQMILNPSHLHGNKLDEPLTVINRDILRKESLVPLRDRISPKQSNKKNLKHRALYQPRQNGWSWKANPLTLEDKLMRPIFERKPLPSILEQIKKVQIQIRCTRTTNVNICRNNISDESVMTKIWSSCTNNPSWFLIGNKFVWNHLMRVTNGIKPTLNMISDESVNGPLRFSISNMNERDKLFQTFPVGIWPCEKFIVKISKFIKEQFTKRVLATHCVLSIIERVNQSLRIHPYIIQVRKFLFSRKIGHDSEQWNYSHQIYQNSIHQQWMKGFLSHHSITIVNPFVVIIQQFRLIKRTCKSAASGESSHRKGNPLKLKDSFRRQIYARESQQPVPKVTTKSDRTILFSFVRVDRIFYLSSVYSQVWSLAEVFKINVVEITICCITISENGSISMENVMYLCWNWNHRDSKIRLRGDPEWRALILRNNIRQSSNSNKFMWKMRWAKENTIGIILSWSHDCKNKNRNLCLIIICKKLRNDLLREQIVQQFNDINNLESGGLHQPMQKVNFWQVENNFLRKSHDRENLPSKPKVNSQGDLRSNSFQIYPERPERIICFASRQFIRRLIHGQSQNIVTPTMRWQEGRKLAAESDLRTYLQIISEILSVVITTMSVSVSQEETFEREEIIHQELLELGKECCITSKAKRPTDLTINAKWIDVQNEDMLVTRADAGVGWKYCENQRGFLESDTPHPYFVGSVASS